MEILIRNEQKKRIGFQKLRGHIERILRLLDQKDIEISLYLVDDAGIRRLNQQYRDIDSETDVLSFPQEEDFPVAQENHLLGDIVISTETAHRQAREHQLTLMEETVLLFIHGFLHLLGYDHERSPEEAAQMKRKTWELFAAAFPGKKAAETCLY